MEREPRRGGDEGALFGDTFGEIARDEPLLVTLYWLPEGPLEDFFVTVQLIGADGRLHAQIDHVAYNDFYPPSAWKAGEMLIDRYQLVPPPEIEPGRYQLILALYDAAGTRWLTEEGEDFLELVAGIEVR